MIIEGHFTSNEIEDAVSRGAKIIQLNYNRVSLSFDSNEIFNQWVEHQKKSHPGLWVHSFIIQKKLD